MFSLKKVFVFAIGVVFGTVVVLYAQETAQDLTDLAVFGAGIDLPEDVQLVGLGERAPNGPLHDLWIRANWRSVWDRRGATGAHFCARSGRNSSRPTASFRPGRCGPSTRNVHAGAADGFRAAQESPGIAVR